MGIFSTATGYEKVPAPVSEPAAGARRIAEIPAPSQAVQIAARLKLVLNADHSMVMVAGIKSHQDGSSLLAAALGAAFAGMDQNEVLIVDGNTHHSILGAILGVPEAPGLLDVLDDRGEVDDVIQAAASGNVRFLPLGRSPRSLASLMGQPRFTQVIDHLRQFYRCILVDCGIMFGSPDALLLAPLCNGIVGAAAAGVRKRHEILDFQEGLLKLRIPLLGIVLTEGGGLK